MIDGDIESIDETKKRLWDNLNKKNSVDLCDHNGLQRLLTFMEIPSFLKQGPKTQLPEINRDVSLINQSNNMAPSKGFIRKASFIPSDFSQSISRIRLGYGDLSAIVNTKIIINKDSGFMQMSPEIAAGLRQMTFGSLKHSFSRDWRNSYISFKDSTTSLGYSLYSEKNATRGFHVCLQAYFLKNLLYTGDVSNESRSRLLKVTESRRIDCLVAAMTEILWKVGHNHISYICLLSNEIYIDSTPFYTSDGVTEKIHIFKFKSIELLRCFIKKHINEFTSRDNSGCILFLYSIVLSKGLQELFEDLDFDPNKSLMTDIETMSQSGINLLLTGYATEYLHNGIQYYDQSNNYLLRPQHGIKERSDIGYLLYNSPDESDFQSVISRFHRRASDSTLSSSTDIEQTNVVGSMLKTPKFPIWVINGNGNMGVLFCLRDDLLSHWRAENNFQLHYINCLPSHTEPCLLSITTRRGRTAKFKSAIMLREENKRIPLLNHLINTKWFGCRVDWNITSTFI